MPLDLLVVIRISRHHQQRIEQAGWRVHPAADADKRRKIVAAHREDIRAVLTIGSVGFTAEEMDALPNLALICAQGVGYEAVDLSAARERGIAVTHGPATNNETVADHAFGLMLACLRRIPQCDAGMRQGEWNALRRTSATLHGKTLGLLGMGNIGQAIARRAHAGFDMPIVYFSRQPKPSLPYSYQASVLAVARQADVLVSALPGGEATKHLVDSAVLEALGERGTLINIGRGSVVDTAALIAALKNRTIAGAGLDVFENEPDIPDALRHEERIVMTPHTGGLSPEAIDATIERVIDNLNAYAAGKPPVTPVAMAD